MMSNSKVYEDKDLSSRKSQLLSNNQQSDNLEKITDLKENKGKDNQKDNLNYNSKGPTQKEVNLIKPQPYEGVSNSPFDTQIIKALAKERIESKLLFYKSNVLKMPKADPKKLTVVFNLKGLLVYRCASYVERRPNLIPLLDFCLDNFNMIVWSSSISKNVDIVLDVAFRKNVSKLIRVYCQDESIPLGNLKSKVKMIKDLSILWADLNYNSNSKLNFDDNVQKKPFNAVNTLIIDDEDDKWEIQSENLICPKPYNRPNPKDKELTKLLQYLKQVFILYDTGKEDIRELIQYFPFEEFE